MMRDTTPTEPAVSLPKLYTTKEIAQIFDVTPETVRAWLNKGQLRGTQVMAHRYLVTRADLIAFAKSHYNVDL